MSFIVSLRYGEPLLVDCLKCQLIQTVIEKLYDVFYSVFKLFIFYYFIPIKYYFVFIKTLIFTRHLLLINFNTIDIYIFLNIYFK